MAWCPHCDECYDAHHATLPCCGVCGHPFLCPCYRGEATPGLTDAVVASPWHFGLWEYNGLLYDDGHPFHPLPPDA